MKLKTLMIAMAAAVAAGGCAGGNGKKPLLPDNINVRAGDIVLRLGTGFTSSIVAGADRKGEYSHVGIVVDSCGQPYVVHAVPYEPDFDGDVDRVKCEPLSSFFSYERANCGEICRVADSVVAARAAMFARDAFDRHVLFDHDYNDADTTRMYCCQLVVWAYKRAGITLVDAEPHSLNMLGLGSFECMLPSDIQHSPYVKSITRF